MRLKKNKEVTRRQFLKGLGLGFVYLAFEYISFNTSAEKAKNLGVSHHIISVPNIDQKWDRTFIVHFSDTHLSTPGVDFMNSKLMKQFTQEIISYLKFIGAKHTKSIVLDTGDLVSARMGNDQPTPLSVLDESLKHISRIPAMACFSVGGNHESYHPQSQEIVDLIHDNDFINLGLENQGSYLLDSELLPFTLAGLPDFTTKEESWFNGAGGDNFLSSIENRDDSKPMVIATHTSMYDSFRNGILVDKVNNALFLHGHTHGSQVGVNTPLGYFAGRYAVFGDWTLRKEDDGYNWKKKGSMQTSKYYRGIQHVGNGNIVSISPGLGHSSFHGPRFVPPGAVIYEIRVT